MIPDDDTQGRVVPMRLQKYLARAGVASRRGSEDLMTAGRVRVNGEVVTELGFRVDPAADTVSVDGREVGLADGPVYVLLNKPAGYVTTMDDPQGRPTVASLVPGDIPGLFPVGRLDMDTTGALLFTTDGELAHRLTHPRYHVEKTYRVDVEGIPQETALVRLRRGVLLEDGPTRPAEARMLGPFGSGSRLEITLREGRKRQVKRMLAEVGHPVAALHRVSFGPLFLGDLAEGETRRLTAEEIAALKRATGDVG